MKKKVTVVALLLAIGMYTVKDFWAVLICLFVLGVVAIMVWALFFAKKIGPGEFESTLFEDDCRDNTNTSIAHSDFPSNNFYSQTYD